RLYRSPWPLPMERLHWASRRTSSWILGSSAGGSSFLLLLLQPTAITARASTAAFFQRITSGIPFRQVVEFHLQAADSGVLVQSILGLLVGRVGLVAAAEPHQQVALQLLAAGLPGLGDLAFEQLERFFGLALGGQDARQALAGQLA